MKKTYCTKCGGEMVYIGQRSTYEYSSFSGREIVQDVWVCSRAVSQKCNIFQKIFAKLFHDTEYKFNLRKTI